MKIVILDSYTTNPGDVIWEPIISLGDCQIYHRTLPDQVYERSKDAKILITNKVVLDKEMIDRLTSLQYIGVIATGYNVVDLKAARKRGIPITNIPNYCTDSVVQMVFALILELTRHVGHHANTVKEGRWVSNRDFCYWDFPQIDLKDKTLGIFGCGTIGKAVARVGIAFGMRVITYDICKQPLEGLDIEQVDFNTLFSQSDIISLHSPLTKETKGIINSSTISMMKKTAYLINTARGPLINEQDLADALNRGLIAGAGLDVLSTEPPADHNPLLKAENCYITPHIAWASQEARQWLIDLAAKNIKAFIQGNPINVVN